MTDHEHSAAAVEFRGVAKQFGSRVVLESMDLTIRRGEFFALLGPSGSGKTTLLKMVSGIEVPDRGEVWLAGRNVTALPPYRRPVHTVFQNYALFPHLDVTGNVGFPLKVAGTARAEIPQRVRQALGWVQLDHLAQRRVDALSGGERQRVALARALVDDPECVLLDEPLSALDPHLRVQTLELLQDIQQRLQATYLYVTHDREEALRAAHRIAVLDRGVLQQVGSPEDVYYRPANPFVASFVGPINWLSGEVIQADGSLAVQLAGGVRVPVNQTEIKTSKVRLGVRPQDVRLGEPGYLRARVSHRQFAGATVSLRLTLKDGAALAAEVPTDQHSPGIGDLVGVAWDPERVHLFKEKP